MGLFNIFNKNLNFQVTAYGGRLNYTIMFVPGSRADPNFDPDVQIMVHIYFWLFNGINFHNV